mmetsp:Transcript_896/g.1362  ORF Transcript_896/g.1362 Transcript_896/m.1362 type:complete len:151 (-) Transcript_896:772-1224(-)
MFKAIKRISRDKAVFDVEVRPIELEIYTNQAFTFKMQLQRGKQSAVETGQYKLDRSVRKTDLKRISINESFKFPCTFYVKDGAPELKTCTFLILKLFPGGNEVVVAQAEVNLGEHFGDAFREKSVELEISKHAQGSNVRVLKYSATISCK